MTSKIVTHDNLFHLDDLFACAILQIVLDAKGESYTVVRTRNKELIAEGAYVVDVGDVYDPATRRFDHHQKGGAGIRDNGVPYASAGLVWKEYGVQVAGSEEVATIIDTKVMQPLDADDSGMEFYKNLHEGLEVLTFNDLFYAFRPTWKEDPTNFDTAFLELLPLAKRFILRKIQVVKDKQEAAVLVEAAYNAAPDKRVILMDKAYPADDVLISKPEVLYKISPNASGTAWGIKTIRKSKESFENRKDLPAAWGGLREEELQKLTGVPDAIFCHNALFLATAGSREGALSLAKLALE